jgi:DNA-binding transcriptional LysR family regulator
MVENGRPDKDLRTMLRGNLAELDAFVAVAQVGGFRAAARELGVSSSSLSQAIAVLEARLGVRLFNRSTRSVRLSSAGEQFLEEINPALLRIRTAFATADTHRAEPGGTLRLNMALGSARMILQPLILGYLRRYPRMSVEITTENAFVDVNAKGFDAGIRTIDAVPPDMISIPIGGDITPVVVGSPEYFRDRHHPETPRDLMAHRCIRARMANGRTYAWEFSRRGETFEIDVPGALTLDDSDLMLQAARLGEGLAYLNTWQVKNDLAEHRLIQVLKEWTQPYRGLSLYYPGRKHLPAKVRAFVDLIKDLRPDLDPSR